MKRNTFVGWPRNDSMTLSPVAIQNPSSADQLCACEAKLSQSVVQMGQWCFLNKVPRHTTQVMHLYYCAKMKHNETNIVIIALATSENFGASCLRHGQKGWPIADEWIGPLTFGLRHPRTTSSDTIQPVRTFTKGSVSPQLDDTSLAKAIHLGIPGHPEIIYIIYVASSWQATACTKRLYQHLLVNFFGQY